MNIFGYDITCRRQKARVPGTLAPETGWQLRPTDGQGPYTKYFAQFIPRKIDPAFFEFLIESVPICGATINRLVTLDGIPVVTGNNQKLVDEINDWMQNVRVNDMQKGLQAFHQCLSRETFEQGFGFGEFIADKKRTDIIGLRVADSKSIKFSRETDGSLRVYQKADGDQLERELNQDNLIYFSVNNENQNPYGTPILRGCEFVAKIITTIHQATGNTWKRFGDPSYSVVYKTSRKDGADLETRRKTIAEELNQAARAKAEGKSADFVRAIDKDSDISIKVIGADNTVILDMDVPLKYLVQDICGITGLPPWMLGYSFSTTERRATFEAEMVLADVSVRQEAKTPHFERLISTMLRLRGRTWQPGDWKLEWKQVNLHDLVAQAQARFLNAQADMMMNTGDQGPGTGDRTPPPKGAKHPAPCACGCDHPVDANKMVHGAKELTRPWPWPALDALEADYEARLKLDWDALKGTVYTLARLASADIAAGMRSAKEDAPFTFTVEQRAAILDALKQYLGEYDPAAPDSPVTWYYGQSYSLGLIHAAAMAGAERPLLDILKNSDIFDELTRTGFQLVKDNATKAIVNKILPEIEAHVIAGSNPHAVASRLNKLFGDQNASWERLARTEMAASAERAKIAEWQARDIPKVEFVPAPDGCPLCQSLRGDYEIGKAPIPGVDTHPRCRCSTRPAAE